MTKVVNLYQTRVYDVYVGRAGMGEDGYFGNPFSMTENTPEQREIVLKAYESYFHNRLEEDAEFKKRVLALKDKTLGCFCKPRSCHGDIIARWLDEQESTNEIKPFIAHFDPKTGKLKE